MNTDIGAQILPSALVLPFLTSCSLYRVSDTEGAGAVSLLTISSCVALVTSAPFTVRILSPICICPFLAAAPLGVIFEMYIDWEKSDTFKCTGTVVRGHGTNKYISFEIDNNERAKFSAVCCFIPLGIGFETIL